MARAATALRLSAGPNPASPVRMFKQSRAALAGLLLILPSPGSGDAAAPTQESVAARRLAVFDTIWGDIRDLYYDPALNGVDWEGVRTHYRPLASNAPDDDAFQNVLRAMTGTLRDAHTRVLTPQQARDRRQDQTTSAGVIIFEVAGEAVIFEVRPDSPAAEAGLRPGMPVRAVNGVPVIEAVARAREDVGPSSSERAALVLSYLRLIAGPPAQPLQLDLEGADGARQSVALVRRALQTTPRFEARALPEGILYVRFDRFRSPVARLLRQALIQHPVARGLILDLRSNTGGEGGEGARAIAPLLDRATLLARLRTRTGRAPSALLGMVRLPLEMTAGEAGHQLFSGPIVVLINEGTASTSEVITASLQERGRARIIGTQSCGCALGVLRYRRLADGRALAISEVGLVTGLGRRIEGIGVIPDVRVDLTLDDFQQGRDRILEAGVQEILRPR